jgi:hypothetical protein
MLQRGTGPTGFVRQDEKVKRVTFAGARHLGSMQPSVSMLNEDAAAGRQIIIDQAQSACYLHVDDGMLLSTNHPGIVHADKLLHHVADGLELAGFDVSDRQQDSELSKIIGYTAIRDPARFQLPGIKLALLRQALLEQVGCHYVDVEVIRSLVGNWLFAALLRRDVLCIPHCLFKFMDTFEGQRTAWWGEARDELKAMAYVTPLLYFDMAGKFAPAFYATDAMGANNVDHGGYGIVSRQANMELIRACLEVGESPGMSVSRLDGDLSGLKFPAKTIKSTIPFSLLPAEMFSKDAWSVVSCGRWMNPDHITLGEGRVVTKLAHLLASFPSAHGLKVITLQDNMPVAGANTKGRSTSWALNRVLRRKASATLTAAMRMYLPWIESDKQPADESSRLQ